MKFLSFFYLSVFLYTILFCAPGINSTLNIFKVNDYGLYDNWDYTTTPNGVCVRTYQLIVEDDDAAVNLPILAGPLTITKYQLLQSQGSRYLCLLQVEVPIGLGKINFTTMDVNLFTLSVPYECTDIRVPDITPVGLTKTGVITPFPYYFEYKINNNIKMTPFKNYLTLNSNEWTGLSYVQLNFKSFFVSFYPESLSNTATNSSVSIGISTVLNNAQYTKTVNFQIPYPEEVQYSLENVVCKQTLIDSAYRVICSLNLLKNDPRSLPLYIKVSDKVNYAYYPMVGTYLNSTVILTSLEVSPGNNVVEIYGCLSKFCQLKYSLSINVPPIVISYSNSLNQLLYSNPLPGDAIMLHIQLTSQTSPIEPTYVIESVVDGIRYPLSTPYLLDGTFGLRQGNIGSEYNTLLYMEFSPLISKYNSIQNAFYFHDYYIGFDEPTPYTLDTVAPYISKLEMIPIPGNNRYIILRVSVVDNDSGFSKLYFKVNGTQPLVTSEDLIVGDRLDGTYEIVIDNPNFWLPEFSITDYSSNSNDYGIRLPTIDPAKKIPVSNPSFYPYEQLSTVFSSANWSYNDIDLTNATYTIVFSFGLENVNKEVSPTLQFVNTVSNLSIDYYPYLENNLFYGRWNEADKKYHIPVQLPMNMISGVVSYQITYFQNISSEFLSNSFPESILRVFSQETDMLGPIVEELSWLNGQPIVAIPAGGIEIGWKLKISDQLNGFEYGNITIVGDEDRVYRNFYFNSSNQAADEYIVSFYIDQVCNSQSFTIKSLYLIDKGGYFSNIGTALLKIPDSLRVLNSSCMETEASTLMVSDFTLNVSTIDVGSNERFVKYSFATSDVVNGIKRDKLPALYLNSLQRIVKKEFTLTGKSNFTHAFYECVFEIPYGFGYPECISLSIYGIMNNINSYLGFDSYTLQALGFPYVIETSIFTTDAATVVQKTGDITTKGGELLIIGKSFGLDNSSVVKIDYNDGKGYSQTSIPTFFSSTVLIINDVKPTTKPFKIQVVKRNGQYTSDETVVVPKPDTTYPPSTDSSSSSASSSSMPSSSSSEFPPVTPTPTQPSNPCINDCGGSSQGYCSVTGCICYSPWMGIDCKSKVIIIPTPSINNTLPSTNISVPTDNGEYIGFTGLVSIVELQELDTSNQLVYKYPFTQWIWSNISTDNEPVKYLYSTNITNQLDQSITNVSVSIQYFDKQQNITFAGELLNMNQYSIKYSINITSYTFTNSLNQLQLIMKVSLESQQDQGCSALESGNTTVTNSEYVKLQVDDHSLYGRFVKRGIIDGRISTITNQLLPNYSSSNQFNNVQSYIGIGIRSYHRLVQLDPDFSVLIDQRPARDIDNSVCSSKSKSKLTKAQLAGIIIGSVGFASIVFVSLAYVIYQKRKFHTLEVKLKTMSQE